MKIILLSSKKVLIGMMVFFIMIMPAGFMLMRHFTRDGGIKYIVLKEPRLGGSRLLPLSRYRRLIADLSPGSARPLPKTEENWIYRLYVYTRRGIFAYYISDTGKVYSPALKKGWVLTVSYRKLLEKDIALLEENAPYGEFLPWEEARRIFCRYDIGRVIDFDTRESFLVQRRAGSGHADVQPLTAQDTAVMKRIYGGKWSWRRRGIILVIKNRRIAASMHGMPHGAGKLANNFPGHFCIHFRDSKTHGRNLYNLSHQIMVWKAAGVTDDIINIAPPSMIAAAAINALDQQEYSLLKMVSLVSRGKWQRYSKRFSYISRARFESLTRGMQKKDNCSYMAKVVFYYKDGRQCKKRIPIELTRKGRWFLTGESLGRLVEGK